MLLLTQPSPPVDPVTCAIGLRCDYSFLYLILRMPVPEATTAALSVGDIAALSDEQLAQFMQKHRSHNGDFDIPIQDGWDELSLHARNELAERLK